jgi:apolipoprotein N-acyltransferase
MPARGALHALWRAARAAGSSPLLGVLGGLLVGLGFLAPRLWFLGLLAPLPLLHALDRQAGALGSLLCGWAAGAAACALGFSFLADLLRHHAGVSGPLALVGLALAALIQGFPWAVHGLGTWVGRRGGLPLAHSFALGHLASTLVPAPIPWSLAGLVTDRVELLQAAEIGGAPAASLLLLSAGIAAHEAWSRRYRSALGWLALFLLGATLGALRLRQIDGSAALAPRWSVGLVGSETAVGRADAAVEGLVALQAARRSLERASPRLVIWPETSLPFAVDEARLDAEIEAQLGSWPATPLLLGASVIDRAGHEHNAALLVDRGSRGRHDKQVLLPLAETWPRGLAWARGLAPWAADRRGGGLDVGMSMDGTVLQVCVCSECLHAGAVRAGATDARSVLVDLSNDGWFDGATAGRLHAGQVRLRAIEQRRFLLRATNRGETGVVGPGGRQQATTWLPGGTLVTIAPLAGRTLFARIGHFPCWIASFLLLACWLRRCVTGSATPA